MVSLDAPALKLELTPEAAIGIAQKEVVKKGWKKFDLSDIVTVYVPFYSFSFDIAAEGGAPPGRAALNANTGEINEFAPVLLERPLAKTRKTPEGMQVEVEETNVKQSEVEKVASVKIANMLGAKRENIVISAISKVYIPFFRMWVDVGGDSFKIEVDGCLGYSTGLENIPAKQKTWDESSGEAIDKMKTPSGIMQLINATIGELSKAITGKGDAKYVQWVLIGAFILIIGFFALQQFTSKIECSANEDFLSQPEFFLFGKRKILPGELDENTLYIEGTCGFSSRENDKLVIAQAIVKKKGIPIASTTLNATTLANGVVKREFQITWAIDEEPGEYELGFEKIVG